MLLVSNMGKAQRTKGHSFERRVAALLRKIYPESRRLLEYQDGEANGVDIKNTGNFKVQCKAMRAQPRIASIFTEFKKLTQEDIPCVVWKQDGKGEYIAFKLEDALLLINAFERSFKDV